MAKRFIKVPYKGGHVDAEEVPVTGSHEEWSSYVMADGSEIRLKPVLLHAAKVPGETDNEGNPVFVVKTQLILSVVGSSGPVAS